MTLHVTPNSTLKAGGTACVSFGPDPNHASETITVEITNGLGASSNLVITLDSNGSGSRTWNVPSDWVSASFNFNGCEELNRAISGEGSSASCEG